MMDNLEAIIRDTFPYACKVLVYDFKLMSVNIFQYGFTVILFTPKLRSN